MRKQAIAIVLGLLASIVVVALGEWIGHQIYPPPSSLDPTNPDDVRRIIEQTPTIALLLVVVAHLLGALVGGWVAGKLSGTRSPVPAWVLGSMLLALGTVTLVLMPGHPVWFWLLDMLVYIPSALIGYHFGAAISVANNKVRDN